MTKFFYSSSIQTQLFTLAIVLGIVVCIIATLTEPFIRGRHDRGIEIGLFAGRIEAIVDNFKRTHSTAEEEAVLASAAKLGISVEKISPQQGENPKRSASESSAIVHDVRALLDGSTREAIFRVLSGSSAPNALAFQVDSDRALVFHMPIFPSALWVYPAVASGILKIAIPLLLLAYFSSRLIIQPLICFAAAAKRVSMDDNTAEPFEVGGSAEIRSLADSLNFMRCRVQQMVEDRTRMLSAISHDLRTPLTRLKMRAERSTEPALQKLMLADISTLAAMIDESLAFLKNETRKESAQKVDLSSLLQTIASDFADTGVDVTFSGPRRLIYTCNPQGITRAISNLIENSSRYATRIVIELQRTLDGEVLVRVCDDGPGLTEKLKARVLEPFFKGDEARTGGPHGGFGLGLSIAQGIVRKGHRGELALLDQKPHGLIVQMQLPPD